MSRPLPPHLALACELHGEGYDVHSCSEGHALGAVVQLADADPDRVGERFGAPPTFRVIAGDGWRIGAWDVHAPGVHVYGPCDLAKAVTRAAALPAPPPPGSPSGLAGGEGAGSGVAREAREARRLAAAGGGQ